MARPGDARVSCPYRFHLSFLIGEFNFEVQQCSATRSGGVSLARSFKAGKEVRQTVRVASATTDRSFNRR
jgi:hypothetical protein